MNKIEAQKWHNYKQQRYEESLSEAKNPQSVQARYRLEFQEILDGCVSPNQLIDLGRALFLRRFSHQEGYGHKLSKYPARSRFQNGHFGGPDASACVDCHWKGGLPEVVIGWITPMLLEMEIHLVLLNQEILLHCGG